MTKDYELVEVIWTDAEEIGDVGWNNLKKQIKESKKPCPQMTSVGYVVYQDKNQISLLSTIGKDLASTVEKIPINFVIEINKLTKKNEKKDKK
tara:strand:- start:1227 stop:1505 length:279 start_codon:yes stop_codon:yes gene_type:complete